MHMADLVSACKCVAVPRYHGDAGSEPIHVSRKRVHYEHVLPSFLPLYMSPRDRLRCSPPTRRPRPELSGAPNIRLSVPIHQSVSAFLAIKRPCLKPGYLSYCSTPAVSPIGLADVKGSHK